MHFHDNGVISEGYVSARDFTVRMGQNDITFKGGEIMKFDMDGGMSEGTMTGRADLIVGKHKISFQSDTARYPNSNKRRLEKE